jgi:hypothetical protein
LNPILHAYDQRDHKKAIANGLPSAEDKSEVWIHPLITGYYIDRREQQKRMKGFVLPQYLVEPQHIEGALKGGGQSNLVLLSPAGVFRAY